MGKSAKCRGFTLVELITIVVLLGIMAAVVMPRFFSRDVFASRGFYDDVLSALRYAQKEAIAQHRYVCVAITSSNVSLTYSATAACPGAALASPAGGAYSITAPSGVTLSTGTSSFYFNPLGQPSFSGGPVAIAVSGYAAPINVEAETGYVHSP